MFVVAGYQSVGQGDPAPSLELVLPDKANIRPPQYPWILP
jgi:hypothetical protein